MTLNKKRIAFMVIGNRNYNIGIDFLNEYLNNFNDVNITIDFYHAQWDTKAFYRNPLFTKQINVNKPENYECITNHNNDVKSNVFFTYLAREVNKLRRLHMIENDIAYDSILLTSIDYVFPMDFFGRYHHYIKNGYNVEPYWIMRDDRRCRNDDFYIADEIGINVLCNTYDELYNIDKVSYAPMGLDLTTSVLTTRRSTNIYLNYEIDDCHGSYISNDANEYAILSLEDWQHKYIGVTNGN